MKIAVPSTGDMICSHFGHCGNFNVFTIENNKIVESNSYNSPVHKPGVLPNFLADLDVNVVIAGGIGGGAIEIFNEKGIDVITGAIGSAKEAVESYLAGTLISTDSVCREHSH